MRFKLILLILSLLTIFFFACNDTSITKVGKNPTIEDVILNYSMVDKSLFFAVKTDDPQGYEDVKTVVYWLYHTPIGSSEEVGIDTSVLLDDGIEGDIIKDDATFTKKFESMEQGKYRIIAEAFDMNDNASDLVEDTLMALENQPPKIYIYDVPDSYEKGEGIIFEIKATDPNGNNDIKDVHLEIQNPDDTMVDYLFSLTDDAKQGDKIQNDGVYTISFPTNKYSKKQGIWKFYFYAIDKSNTMSNEIIHNVSNPGLTVIYPDSSETKSESFSAGERINIQWDVALIDTVVLEYSINANEANPEYIKIGEIPRYIKEYEWTIPSNIDSKKCKIHIFDKYNPSRSDYSDEYFEVKQ